jgi:hypothetical protein
MGPRVVAVIAAVMLVSAYPMAWLGANIADPPGTSLPTLGVIIQTSGYLLGLGGIPLLVAAYVWALAKRPANGTTR